MPGAYDLPPPTTCNVCTKPRVVLTTNRAVFGNGAIDPAQRIYFCRYCRASVGVHDGSDKPKGYLADSVTRSLRARCHNTFDPLWAVAKLSRSKAYAMLAEHLGIPVDECHFGLMTRENLKKTLEFCDAYKEQAREDNRRRIQKRVDRQKAKAERDYRERKRLKQAAHTERSKRFRRSDDC